MRLCQRMFSGPARLSLPEFAAACDHAIALEHAAARAAGILFPEIFWPDIALEVLPELAACAPPAREDFLFQHASLSHTVRLPAGAADTLRRLRERGMLLGIASNAQSYTLRELAEALSAAGLSFDLFVPELCFWSFAHGFSKPNPHVFRLLTARLRARQVAPDEILMVGDRIDNDIAPARAQGWRTWQLAVRTRTEDGGDWTALAEFLAGSET